jgi:hypothetical protein
MRRAGAQGDDGHRLRVALLGALLAASVLSTALHYTHNFIEIEHYPQSAVFSNDAIRAAIVVAWPLLTAAGLLGFRWYAQGRYRAAYPLLAAYSLLGIVTLGHFTEGSPHIGPFWYTTIFTDFVAGVAVLAFAHWSAVTVRRPLEE